MRGKFMSKLFHLFSTFSHTQMPRKSHKRETSEMTQEWKNWSLKKFSNLHFFFSFFHGIHKSSRKLKSRYATIRYNGAQQCNQIFSSKHQEEKLLSFPSKSKMSARANKMLPNGVESAGKIVAWYWQIFELFACLLFCSFLLCSLFELFYVVSYIFIPPQLRIESI